MIVKRVVSVFKAGGLSAVLIAVARRIRTMRARSYPIVRPFVTGSIGVEIGGPSPIFARGGLLPLYALAGRIDNCNFARTTIWEGTIAEGQSFTFDAGKAPGRQFIAEGADLHMIPEATYDFVLSSHMLEHTANPLGALAGWARLLKTGGALVLLVPHRDGTFDHRRPLSTLEHLMEDFDAKRGEDDLTHLPEVLALHDLERDPGAQASSFQERATKNAELRTLHHHVFDTQLVIDAVAAAGLEPVAVEPLRPYHVLVVARKPVAGRAVTPLSDDALRRIFRASPFPTDRARA